LPKKLVKARQKRYEVWKFRKLKLGIQDRAKLSLTEVVGQLGGWHLVVDQLANTKFQLKLERPHVVANLWQT
jgi:hypothetical protein